MVTANSRDGREADQEGQGGDGADQGADEARSRGSVMAVAPARPAPPDLEAGAAAAPGRGPASSGPQGATGQAGLGPVGLGHRHQLGHVQAVGGGLADQGGGGVLVAVAGGRGHGQAQPMAGRRRPGRLRRRGRSRPRRRRRVGLDGQVPWRPLRASWPAAWASTQVRAPGKTSAGRQDRARATRAWAVPGSRRDRWFGRPSGARSGPGDVPGFASRACCTAPVSMRGAPRSG